MCVILCHGFFFGLYSRGGKELCDCVIKRKSGVSSCNYAIQKLLSAKAFALSGRLYRAIIPRALPWADSSSPKLHWSFGFSFRPFCAHGGVGVAAVGRGRSGAGTWV